jgi:uncharacterized protein YkwD
MHPTPTSARRRAAGWSRLALVWLTGLCALGVAWAQPTDDDFANQVLTEVNRYRQDQQRQPLRPAPWLATLAAEHSAAMAQMGAITHAGFQTRFLRARRQTCVENLAAGFTRAGPLVAGWRASPDHHRNLLDTRVQEVGVASVNGHVTWLACSATGVDGR